MVEIEKNPAFFLADRDNVKSSALFNARPFLRRITMDVDCVWFERRLLHYATLICVRTILSNASTPPAVYSTFVLWF